MGIDAILQASSSGEPRCRIRVPLSYVLLAERSQSWVLGDGNRSAANSRASPRVRADRAALKKKLAAESALRLDRSSSWKDLI